MNARVLHLQWSLIACSLTAVLAIGETGKAQQMIKDLGAGTQGPSMMVDFHGRVLFRADNGLNGAELWISDGTPGGTNLVKDIHPGWSEPVFPDYVSYPLSSAPSPILPVGDKMLLLATDPDHGRELWITDGTTAGTNLLKDLSPGPGQRELKWFAPLGRTVIFVFDHIDGDQLWITDGTGPGTVEIEFSRPGSDSLYISSCEYFDGRVFFSANDATHGHEMWVSDGTAAGTVLFKDLVPGTESSYPGRMVAADNQLFFLATDPVNGTEVWVSDGTAAGTQMVKDVFPGAGGFPPQQLCTAGDKAFFTAADGVHSREPWVSDGTAAGTFMLKDVDPTGYSPLGLLTPVGDKLFFFSDYPTTGRDLWVSDGTTAGTVMLKNIQPAVRGYWFDSPYATSTQRMFFVAGGDTLWTSDGTTTGTVPVGGGAGETWDVYSGWSSTVLGRMYWNPAFVLSNGKLFYLSTLSGLELWSHHPGASSKQVGYPSGVTRPRLKSTGAVIGGSWDLSVDSDISNTFGYLALSPPALPTWLPLGRLARDHQIYLDLLVAGSSPLIPVNTDANGDWSLSISVPGGMSPSAALCVQGVLINGPKWDLTNAVHFSIGH